MTLFVTHGLSVRSWTASFEVIRCEHVDILQHLRSIDGRQGGAERCPILDTVGRESPYRRYRNFGQCNDAGNAPFHLTPPMCGSGSAHRRDLPSSFALALMKWVVSTWVL